MRRRTRSRSGSRGGGKGWTVYVVRCRDGSLYTGITDALDARIEAHNLGKGVKYTRSRLPVRLVWHLGRQTASDARRLEAALKRRPKVEKERLVAGDEGIWRRMRRAIRRRGKRTRTKEMT